MKRVCLSLAFLGLLFAAPGLSGVGGGGECNIQGTWYGFNTFGETIVQGITRTGPKTYTAVAQRPASPVPTIPFVIGDFAGFHGDLTRTGPSEFDGTWLIVQQIDPAYDLDLDPFFGGAGCGAGWDLMATVIFGPVTMPTCDSWTATFDLDFVVYTFGTDLFADGCHMGNPFGPGQGFHQRLPKLP